MKTEERGLARLFRGLLLSAYIQAIDRCMRPGKKGESSDRQQTENQDKVCHAKGYFKSGGERKCSTRLEKRPKESKRRREGGREVGAGAS